jgi:hypothetical protein
MLTTITITTNTNTRKLSQTRSTQSASRQIPCRIRVLSLIQHIITTTIMEGMRINHLITTIIRRVLCQCSKPPLQLSIANT